MLLMLLNTDADNTIRAALTTATWVLGIGIAVLLAMALLGEIFRVAGRAPGLVRAVDHATPLGLRRVAAALVAVMATVAGSIAPALAAQPAATTGTISVRAWLNGEPDPQLAGEHDVPGLPVADPGDPSPADVPDNTGSHSRSGLTYTPRTGPASGPGSPIAGSSGAGSPGAGSSGVEAATSPGAYLVTPGDSLWRIASRLLGSDAKNLQIDATWRRIYASNMKAIGSNPGLIHPGLELTLPPPD